jgi:hypothetical protein
MDSELLMAFKDNKIMSVSFVVAEKQILAVGRVYLLPVFQGQFNGRKGRMVVGVECYSMFT